MQRAIQAAITSIREADCDARVLVLGGGGGLLALMALKAGAEHVTVVDR